MGRSPAFQCYAKDLYTGTSDLSSAEFGAFWRGVCWSWDNGPLPLDNEPRRRTLLLTPREFRSIWPAIRNLWKRTPKGWINVRLEAVRKEQDDYYARQSAAGRKSAAQRASRVVANQNPTPLDSGSNQTGNQKPSLRSAPAPAEDQELDQDHRADARAELAESERVLIRLAHDALSQNPDDATEILKGLAAKAHIAYDGITIQSALSQAEAQRSKVRYLRAMES